MSIRVTLLASRDELDDVIAIEEASFTNPWTREMYEAELAKPSVAYFLLARNDSGQTVGFCSFWHVVDEVHVNNIAVLPEHRRAGVGSALVAALAGEAERLHAQTIFLEVRRSNEPALALYQRFGFTIVHTRRSYYSHPVEDALVLSRASTARATFA